MAELSKCKVCGMEFENDKRLEIHSRTHKSKRKKRQKETRPDFDRPDFSQVNI